MKEGLKQYMVKKLSHALQIEGKRDSTSHLLIANPQQWYNMFGKNTDLNNLSQENISTLWYKENKVLIIENYYENDQIRKARGELKFLERDGKFELSLHELKTAEEKVLFVVFSEIPEKQLPGMKQVCKKLTSIPFELNKKTSYGFMISESFKFLCLKPFEEQGFRKNGSDVKEHDNGQALLAIVFFNRPKKNKEILQKVKNEITEEETQIKGERGKFVLLKSRRHSFSIQNLSDRKRFVAFYYVNGARDLKNKLF